MDATGKNNWKTNISSAEQMGVYVDNAVKFLRWAVMRSYLRPPHEHTLFQICTSFLLRMFSKVTNKTKTNEFGVHHIYGW